MRRRNLSAVAVLATLAVVASAVAQSTCVTPTPTKLEICVGSQGDISWSNSGCGSPPPYNNSECERVGSPDTVWTGTNSGSSNVLTIHGNSTGAYSVTVSGTNVYQVRKKSDAPADTICPTSDNVPLGSGTAEVVVYGLTQFNAKADKFPKCRGEGISKDDFVIVTNPTGYEDRVTVTGLSTNPTNADGTPKAGAVTLTATATLCGSSTPAQYEVLGDETTEQCQNVPSRPYSATFTDVVQTYTTWSDALASTGSNRFYHERKKSGTVTGASVPTKKGESEWTSCGGGIEVGQEAHWEISGSIGAEWTLIADVLSVTAGGSVSFGGSTSVTFSHDGMTNKQIRQQAWSHPVSLTVSGTITASHACYYSLQTGTICDPWVADSTAYSEPDSGELAKEMALCLRCCHV